jgi:hypothetical protein
MKVDVGQIIVDVELEFVKSTGGTHVFGNSDAGFKAIYVPKMLFPVGADVTKLKLRMTLGFVEEKA